MIKTFTWLTIHQPRQINQCVIVICATATATVLAVFILCICAIALILLLHKSYCTIWLASTLSSIFTFSIRFFFSPPTLLVLPQLYVNFIFALLPSTKTKAWTFITPSPLHCSHCLVYVSMIAPQTLAKVLNLRFMLQNQMIELFQFTIHHFKYRMNKWSNMCTLYIQFMRLFFFSSPRAVLAGKWLKCKTLDIFLTPNI